MRFINETQHAAKLVRLTRDEQSMAAVMVVKSTYVIEGGRCTLSRRQHAVLDEPTMLAQAVFEPEGVVGKVGVDLLVVGEALAPAAGTRMMAIGAAVGPWVRQLLVFGDRVWRRSMWSWSASEPAPFERMPVSWANAYGGVARCGGNPSPHPGNAQGKGYVLDVDDQVEGVRLPNIEDPDDLLEAPGQRVEPAGFGPLPSSSAIRVTAALDDSKLAQVNRSIFNVAPPRHRLEALHGGERCELWGWTGLEHASFEVPVERVVVEVGLAGRVHEFWPQIDTVCVLPTTRELIVIRRAAFTYLYGRSATRVARLRDVESALSCAAGGIRG